MRAEIKIVATSLHHFGAVSTIWKLSQLLWGKSDELSVLLRVSESVRLFVAAITSHHRVGMTERYVMKLEMLSTNAWFNRETMR